MYCISGLELLECDADACSVLLARSGDVVVRECSDAEQATRRDKMVVTFHLPLLHTTDDCMASRCGCCARGPCGGGASLPIRRRHCLLHWIQQPVQPAAFTPSAAPSWLSFAACLDRGVQCHGLQDTGAAPGEADQRVFVRDPFAGARCAAV